MRSNNFRKDNDLYESRFGFQERNAFFRFLVILLCATLLLGGFRIYWVSKFAAIKVVGSSMNNTLQTGEWLLMERTQAKRGDVIVVDVRGYSEFDYDEKGKLVEEDERTKFLIKRLIATEGEWVRCTDGVVEISKDDCATWEVLYEPYAYYGVNDRYKKYYDFDAYEVKTGEIFFLGDNRSGSGSSIDSRYERYEGEFNGNGSRLDRLYKASDIYGVVSQWAIDNSGWLKYFIALPWEW